MDPSIRPVELAPDHPVQQIAAAVGGTVEEAGALPDGSGFATVSFPLPKNHWLYAAPVKNGYDAPPMPWRVGEGDPRREVMRAQIVEAARYAVRASTMRGRDDDYDPDALVQNMVVGMLGYFTPDGLSEDAWANPDPVPPLVP